MSYLTINSAIGWTKKIGLGLSGMLILLTLISSPALAAEVGEVSYVRGIVSATTANGELRLVNRNAKILEKDTIQTGKDSIAVIRFIDDTHMTLRPHTTFRIDEYKYNNSAEQDKGFFSLVKGGFRALSGFLSKNSPDSVKYSTTTATIGVRGTEFDARLCEPGECGQTKKSRSASKNKPQHSLVVGRVAFKKGELIAINALKKSSTQLSSGGPVYQGDRLITGNGDIAVIAFTDQSRVTLLSNSQLVVEQFKYEPEQPRKNISFFNLLKGGVRAVTGLIAGLNRENVQFKTLTATIGVRGTGFDILCDGSCQPGKGRKPMRVNVWDGSVAILQPDRETIVSSGNSALVQSPYDEPSVAPSNKRDLQNIPSRPDSLDVDFEQLFGQSPMSSSDPDAGLYVSVYDGHVSVENDTSERVDIGAGESAFSGVSGNVIRLDQIPDFQINDSIPAPDEITSAVENTMSLLSSSPQSSSQGLECSIN